ncbi:SusC/RagA family TonB-linked outer membrane protein [Chitinophaga pendula]|uniref:SusC/RagA family TonB-linked outer membrane protein n=1 Tax=Chitinophaga TaxID=79328 RepID=UPI000BB0ABA3|nr:MULTISPECIES: SusC/RagA family TonB-linked outer membrane protein [Chitinophaga]ASZ14124.1 hypothetical protein CK934_25835 [Chitinophaga sp. MD30]UCJ08240.1 SusC/RagA family TonB-linked outer membrane protein [Chitinophaga pendula]
MKVLKKITGNDRRERRVATRKYQRLRKIMWISCLSMQVYTAAYGQQVTIRKQQVAVIDALNSVKQQTGYYYVGQVELLKATQPVDLQLVNASLETTLQAIFKDQPLTWSLRDKTIIVKRKQDAVFQSTNVDKFTSINGEIRNTQGTPLPGASILLQGTQKGTAADANGHFHLDNITFPAILEIHYTGYLSKIVRISHSENIQVILEPAEQQMNAVIVTGYSQKKISELTGSLSTVKGEDLRNVTTSSVIQQLQGKLAGLIVSSPGGDPAASPNMSVRGVGSLGGNTATQPLVVIDGLIQDAGTAANINPNDVESVTLLKDAASAALYGSRAANGVLLINTKKGGSPDGKPQINFEAVYSREQPTFGKFRMMNADERYTLMEQAYSNDYRKQNPTATPEAVNNYLSAVMPDKAAALANNTNWLREGYRIGQLQRYNLSINGGTNRFKYYAGGSYHHEVPVAITDKFDKYQLRVNTVYSPSDRFTITTAFNGTYTKAISSGLSNYRGNLYGMMPWDNPYKADGTYRVGGPNEPNWYSGTDTYNPLYDASLQDAYNHAYIAGADVKLQYRVTPWLSLSTANRLTYNGGRSGFYTDPRDSASGYPGGYYSQNRSQQVNYITSNIASFNKRFGLHEIKGLAGMEFNDVRFENTSVSVRNITPGKRSITTGTVDRVSESISEIAFLSYLSEINYSFLDRYFLSGSFRRDGSSKFGSNNKFGNFYSIGAAWNISDETFLANNRTITQLRLRFSHGTSGNADPVGAYSIYGVYNYTTGGGDNYNGAQGIIPGAQGDNPDLHWEVQRMNNLGLNIGLWDRIRINIDLYDKANNSLLRSVPAAITSGISSVVKNIGKISNRGMEIEITSTNTTGKVKWNTSLNLAFNRNKVLYLTGVPTVFPTTGTNNLLAPGYAVGSYWGVVYTGADEQTGLPTYEKEVDGKRSRTTDIKQATLRYLGSQQPDCSGGITNTITYKDVTLSILLDFVSGLRLTNDLRGDIYGPNELDGASVTTNNVALPPGQRRWEHPGDVAFAPAATLVGYADARGWFTTRFLENASYLRIRNVRLNYNTPKRWLSRIHAQQLSVFVSGDYLYTFTGFTGLDPENGGRNFENASKYIINRKLTAGVNLTF